VIFADSSEATLCRMFGRSTEPFYNWAPLEPFELLGEEFVRAMVRAPAIATPATGRTWCCEWITGTIGCRTTLWPSGCEIGSSRIDVKAIPTSVFGICSAIATKRNLLSVLLGFGVLTV
jgi:hypothetical protein